MYNLIADPQVFILALTRAHKTAGWHLLLIIVVPLLSLASLHTDEMYYYTYLIRTNIEDSSPSAHSYDL